MTKIKVLDQHLANLIAAGEVVDRPSAIVKELIENAIDGAATNINIRIKNGGLEEIAVYDNGVGMSKEDLKLAFLAHSTSKISKAYDLQHLSSLGFRGEALAAIGAVSHCEIISNDGSAGYSLRNKHGQLGEVKPQAANPGTSVIVRELFYQSAARIKFLKSVEYESSLISDLIQKFALSYLDIAFQYYNNERLTFSSSGQGKLDELLFEIYGANVYSHLQKIDCADYDFTISGYLSDSHYARSNKTGINLFLNNRLIASNNITKAIVNAYSDHLAKGKYPLVILKINSDPQLLDVNVTATKWQVRIAKEKELIALLSKGIKEVLRQQTSSQWLQSFSSSTQEEEFLPKENREHLKEETTHYQQLALVEEVSLSESNKELSIQPTVIGQAFGKYIVASFQDELWLIDQHAAQERCNYEKFKEALKKTEHLQQFINLPPFEVSLTHMQRLKEINDTLVSVGINLEEYGPKKLLLRSVPLWLLQVDVEAFVKDLLDYCLENETIDNTELQKASLASLACHSSIKFNEYLDRNQQIILVNELMACENPYHCPHGRPTIVKLSDQQLSKEFQRG